MGFRTGKDLFDSIQGQVGGSCKHGNQTFGFCKMEEISWLQEDLLASQEGLCCVKLVVSLQCDNLPFVEREEHRDAVTEKRVLREILGYKVSWEI